MKLRTITPPGTGTAFDKARRLSGEAKTPQLPMAPPTTGPDHAEPSDSRANACTACHSDLVTGRKQHRTGEREGSFVRPRTPMLVSSGSPCRAQKSTLG